MARRDLHWKLASTALLALGLAGCSGMADTFKSDAGWFSKPISGLLSREDGSGNQGNRNFTLGPTGPVGPEELINADGSCAPAAAEAPAAAPTGAQADAAPATPAAGDAAPPVLGGVALGMTECQVARRAGTPSNVAIGAGDNNERKVVLTYLGGPWPGVYTFASGRLKVVDEVPQAQKPAKKPVAKKKRAPAKRG